MQIKAQPKLVFLIFETKYLTPKIGPYIKLKLLKVTFNTKKIQGKKRNALKIRKQLQFCKIQQISLQSLNCFSFP